jgi:hypothetical protein
LCKFHSKLLNLDPIFGRVVHLSNARGCPHTRAARPRPWLHPLCVRSPWQPPDDALSPI